ncbi:hypothetical protein [Escherichia coli]|uniref:hypothetical protein n=1 Tax=Escherichia coli TaxID=562 RepID=UPI002020BE56|nr:hypothetical protein [Escherichia coli]MCL7934132.1 hypothetical protein [Escherichia coli]
MFAGKKSAQIREILISESAWEEMTCLFAPSLIQERVDKLFSQLPESMKVEDSITHDRMDERALYNLFAGMVANRIGLGFSALRK